MEEKYTMKKDKQVHKEKQELERINKHTKTNIYNRA